jgi:hypothetical protein
MGKYVDGATRGNDPLWGLPSLKSFRDLIFHISGTRVAIALKMELMVSRIRCEESFINSTGLHY